MFDTRVVGFAEPARARTKEQVADLRELAGKVAPVVLAGEQLIPVPPVLEPLLPNGGLRRGSVVSIEGQRGAGATSLLFQLVAGASAGGSWVALVGMDAAGAVAAAEAGIDLDRLAIVAQPGGNWPLVTAALLDAIDIVAVRPSTRVRPQDARRLATRARDRGGVLVVAGAWPEGADIRLTAQASRWEGLAFGHGVLRSRSIEVVADGRGAAARRRHRQISA